MTRKKVKLAWIENPNSRATSMRKRRLGLLKKVREITILCDVKGCIIIFSPNCDEPMVWPSVEATRELLHHFFALPEAEKLKRETSLESYMKQKTAKMHEEVAKLQKKNKEYGIDLLMDQMNRDRETANLTLSEIYTLLSFLKEKIILCRKKLGPALFPPLRSPPRVPFGLQFEEVIRTRTKDVPLGGHVEEESSRNNEQASGEGLNIGTAIIGDQGQYVLDQWVPISSERENHQQTGMNQVCYNEYPSFKSYLPYQGSSSNGNPNVEMEPVLPQLMMTFYDLGGSVSQPFQHLGMNSPIEAISQQPMQYTFNPMSHEYGVNEEDYNINNGGSEIYRSNNTITFNNGTRQEQPPNGTTAAGEGNVNLKPFDINKPPGF